MLARFALIIFDAGKSPYESVHSVTIEPTQLNSVGTKTAYQATGGLRNRLAQIQVTSAAVECGVVVPVGAIVPVRSADACWHHRDTTTVRGSTAYA